MIRRPARILRAARPERRVRRPAARRDAMSKPTADAERTVRRRGPARRAKTARRRARSASPAAWLPLALLTAAALAAGPLLAPWVWTLAIGLALYIGFKWMTWWEAAPARRRAPAWRSAAYLLAWPGMDAYAFLLQPPLRPPTARAWLVGAVNLVVGCAVLWGVGPRVSMGDLATGWLGMLGLGLVFHFGGLRLLSLAWRSRGVRARPLFDRPHRARSLDELWSERWNLAVHDLARRYVLRPLAPRIGTRPAVAAIFLISGLLHELLMSVPAGGGYGLPTLYFALQLIGTASERTAAGRRLGLGGGGPRARIWTFAVALAPVPLLFHPWFVGDIVVPFLEAIGAAR